MIADLSPHRFFEKILFDGWVIHDTDGGTSYGEPLAFATEVNRFLRPKFSLHFIPSPRPGHAVTGRNVDQTVGNFGPRGLTLSEGLAAKDVLKKTGVKAEALRNSASEASGLGVQAIHSPRG